MRSLVLNTQHLRTFYEKESFYKNLPRTVLSSDEEICLIRQAQQGCSSSLNQLTTAHMPFIITVANTYRDSRTPMSDLINQGSFGFVKAIYRFDETKGITFLSYAIWWIRKFIIIAIREEHPIHLAVNKHESLRKIKHTVCRLEQTFERTPTVSEIAEVLHRDPQEINLLLSCFGERQVHALDPKDFEQGACMTIENDLDISVHHKHLQNHLDSINHRERQILVLYFGLNGEDTLTLEQIGQRFSLTRERVRQIKKVALSKLQKKTSLRYFYEELRAA